MPRGLENQKLYLCGYTEGTFCHIGQGLLLAGKSAASASSELQPGVQHPPVIPANTREASTGPAALYLSDKHQSILKYSVLRQLLKNTLCYPNFYEDVVHAEKISSSLESCQRSLFF